MKTAIMKIIPTVVINGWRFSPQCWRDYLKRPLRIERFPCYLSIEIFGVYLVFELQDKNDESRTG